MKRFKIFPKIFTLLVFLSILQVCPLVKAESEGTDLIISLDSSGSMIEGMAFEAAKEAAKAQVAKLTTGDYISVLRFDQSAQTVVEQEITSSDQRDKVIKQIESLQPQGAWTNVSDALDATGRTLKRLQEKLPNYRHIVYLITDGGVRYGPNQPSKQIDAVAREYWDNFVNSNKIYKFYIYSTNWPPNQEWMRFATSCRATISDKAMSVPTLIKFTKNIAFADLVIYAGNLQGTGTVSGKLHLEEFRGDKTEILVLSTKNVDFPPNASFSVTQPKEIICNGPDDYPLTLEIKGEISKESQDKSYSREFKLFFMPKGNNVEILPREGITCTVNITHSRMFTPPRDGGGQIPPLVAQSKIIFGENVNFAPIKLGDNHSQAITKGILQIENVKDLSEQEVSLYLGVEGLPPGVACKLQTSEIKVNQPGQREISVLFSGMPSKEGVYNLVGRLLPQVDDRNVIVSPKEIICRFNVEIEVKEHKPLVQLSPADFDLGEFEWREEKTIEKQLTLTVEELEQTKSERLNLVLEKAQLGDNLQAELKTKEIECTAKGQRIPVVLTLQGRPPQGSYTGTIRITPQRGGVSVTPNKLTFLFKTQGEPSEGQKVINLLFRVGVFLLMLLGGWFLYWHFFVQRSVTIYAKIEGQPIPKSLTLKGNKPTYLNELGREDWYIRRDPSGRPAFLFGQGKKVPALNQKPVKYGESVDLSGTKITFTPKKTAIKDSTLPEKEPKIEGPGQEKAIKTKIEPPS